MKFGLIYLFLFILVENFVLHNRKEMCLKKKRMNVSSLLIEGRISIEMIQTSVRMISILALLATAIAKFQTLICHLKIKKIFTFI